jgi:hypothetical protein
MNRGRDPGGPRGGGSGANLRFFCLLERNADDLGGPSVVCIDGLTKPV